VVTPGTAGAAKFPDSADRVKVRAASLEDGARLAVTLEIDDGWHVYGPGDFEKQDTIVRVTKAPAGVQFGEFTPDRAPETTKGEFERGPRKEFHGTVTYAAEVLSAPVGTFEVEGEVVVAACNAEGCMPLGAAKFRATLSGAAKVVAPAPVKQDEGISFAFLLAAMGAGLLTILTPCVFPMLPLTISLLTKSAEKEPGRVVPNALAYGAGMFLSLAGLGLFLTLVLNQAPTALTQTAWFNLAIFAFLMYLALSLFGAYDIQLPAFLTNWSQGKAGTGGGAGLFFMGMTLAFTSFACAAPFAGALLVRAREHLAEGVVGMGVYAASFSVPFVVLALFPGALRRLPKSGGWLNAVKVVMGFIEVAAAFKFLRGADLYWQWGIFSRSLVLSIWIACSLGAALYLLGLLVLPHDTKAETIGVTRLLFALLFLSTAFVLLPGVFRRPLHPYVDSFVLDSDDEPLIPWTASTGGGKPSDGLEWIHDDLDRGLALARETGRPVFVDFSGVT
jgi:thiol:disulfide interchange protein DsbD